MAVQWYYKMAGKEFGPFTSQELKQLAEEKRIAPTDPVRRDTDTEWSLAKNVKGLFPAATAIPMGVAVPVTPVKEPPVVVSAVKKPARAAKVEEPEEESFDFGFDSSVSQGTKSHKTSTAKRAVSSKTTSKSVSRKKAEAEDEEEGEKKPLTKKEIQKRNFMIIAGATVVVIVLAVLILVIVSCKGSSKPKATSNEAVVTEEVQTEETAEAVSEDKPEAEDVNAGKKEEEEPAEESIIPAEFVNAGYKTPYVDGKTQTCTFGKVKVSILSIQNAKLGKINPKATKNKDREYCFVKISVKNASDEDLIDVPGWGAKGSRNVKLFAGKNLYATQKITVPDQADSTVQIDGGDKFTDVLVFNPPKLKSIDALRLELPPLIAGDPTCKLYIPKEMFQKKDETVSEDGDKEEKDGEEVEGSDSTEEKSAEKDVDVKTKDAKEEGAKDNDSEAEDAKQKEKKEPTALDDEALEDVSDSESSEAASEPEKTPAASPKESGELDGASEENEEDIDILNDPNLM